MTIVRRCRHITKHVGCTEFLTRHVNPTIPYGGTSLSANSSHLILGLVSSTGVEQVALVHREKLFMMTVIS